MLYRVQDDIYLVDAKGQVKSVTHVWVNTDPQFSMRARAITQDTLDCCGEVAIEFDPSDMTIGGRVDGNSANGYYAVHKGGCCEEETCELWGCDERRIEAHPYKWMYANSDYCTRHAFECREYGCRIRVDDLGAKCESMHDAKCLVCSNIVDVSGDKCSFCMPLYCTEKGCERPAVLHIKCMGHRHPGIRKAEACKSKDCRSSADGNSDWCYGHQCLKGGCPERREYGYATCVGHMKYGRYDKS